LHGSWASTSVSSFYSCLPVLVVVSLGFAWFLDYGDVDHGFMLKRSSSRRYPITYCLFDCL
jgi:hypothetical protein